MADERSDVDRLRRRLQVLADATRELAAATDQERIFQTIVRRTAELVGGFTAISMLTSDGLIIPVAHYHPDPGVMRMIASVVSRAPIPWDSPLEPAVAIRTGEPDLKPELDPPRLLAFAAHLPAEDLAVMATIHSALFVPIRVDDKPRGCLAIVRMGDDGPALDDEDLALAQALAQHAGVAIARTRTEQALRQALKLEAVGRLAGGIAHDFNNMLSVILSYAGTLRRDTELSVRARLRIEEIEKAGLRAADLTRQLLAFSRQQVLEPRVLDLAQLIRGIDAMLHHLVGEDITLDFALPDTPVAVRADPGQLEQVIVNLVVNARDAMPRGGPLTIGCRVVELDADEDLAAGRYAQLWVTDAGVGMDAETLEHLFEPFYTTKERGRGTGLGLATVFGVVKQAGGGIRVHTAKDRGSRFEIYLPHTDAPLRAHRATEPVTLDGTETVLLVEDEPQLRQVAAEVLERHGYRVLAAEGADEALRALAAHEGPIHLLLTDVVMPQMSGRELAEQVATLRPDTRVLYMSGYTDDAVVRHGVESASAAFLSKPITPSQLLRKVRQVLDGT